MPPSLMTARDIPLLITSTASSSERRITPSWTIAHLKTKLEPVTGIPAGSQRLTLRLPDQGQERAIEAEDEETVEIGRWPLVAYAEIKVTFSGLTTLAGLPSLSAVPKYEMPMHQYERRTNSVFAIKKAQKIGRFDPKAPEIREHKVNEMKKELEERNITIGARCRLANESTRRGTIRFVGPIPSLPGLEDAPWIGIELDEPTGKNDGSIKGERYFQCEKNWGVFVRAEKVEVGDFRKMGLDDDDPDMEEI